MTPGTVRAALLALAALVSATSTVVADDPPAPDPLLAAMESAYLSAEKDHARVRAAGFGDGADAFFEALAKRLRAAAASKDAPDVAAEVKALLEGAPLSAPSLRVVLARLLPADRAGWPAEGAERSTFLAAAREVFSDEKFADCWDRRFGDLPEVAAWRAAEAKRAEERREKPPEGTAPGPGAGPKDGPGTGPADGPSGPGPGTAPPGPAPGPESPPEKPTPPTPEEPRLPPPDDPNPLANLVPVESGRAWVGPWTGYDTEFPAKDNRRQKRPAKTVWIDRYEVTCAEYLAFLRGLEPARRRAMLPVGWPMGDDLEPSMPPGRERTPVTGVTFGQASAYALAAGKRLPTEDEWDRAAGGGEKDARLYPWGGSAEGRKWAQKSSNVDGPVAVDAFPDDCTPDGIVGFAGNVAELVATLPDRRELPAKLLPTLQITIRGGSYRTTREAECATSYRWFLGIDESAPHVGFRCVMDEREYRRRAR